MAKIHLADLAAIKEWEGKELPLSDWKRIDQHKIDQFAASTEDFQWIHTDIERAAKESPFGRTIAHGFLTLSLLSGMIEEVVSVDAAQMGVNYGLNKARFLTPVPVDSELRLRLKIARTEAYRDNGLKVSWDCEIEIKGLEKPALVGEFLTLLFE